MYNNIENKMNNLISVLLFLTAIVIIGIITKTKFMEHFTEKHHDNAFPIKNINNLTINSCELDGVCGYNVPRLGFKQNVEETRETCLKNPFNTFLQHEKLYGPTKMSYTNNKYDSPFFNPLRFHKE
jgi:hypothetical protein